VGHTFEQLRYILDRVADQSRVGVCLDTCHMFAAGYDISTPAAYAATMQHFDDIVGWHNLKGCCLLKSFSACPFGAAFKWLRRGCSDVMCTSAGISPAH
jgi:endonuclease IV